jgi:phenylalanyl-tRNA synthetase beta chain
MVVVEYAYEEMKRLVDLPLEKMIASLSELGAPSEYEPGVGKVITELTPNRPDWYSMEGLARSLRAYHGKGHPGYSTEKSDFRVVIEPGVKEVRPYTACAVVRGMKLDDQRIRDMVLLQEKLIGTLGRRVKKFGLGLYPLSAIRFPVRYTTMKPSEIRYVPLGHGEEMDAGRILAEHKKGQQYGHIIKGHKRYPVFVDSEGKIMALIPIVNSAETGKVDQGTRDIFIEVSGTDMNACKSALNIICCSFADMGGKVFEVTLEYGKDRVRSPDLSSREIELDLEAVNRTLGLSLGEKEAAALLARMGYGYSRGKAVIPPYRADVLGQVDVIEDIAIAYGYNNFVPTIPDFFNPGSAIRDYEDVDAVMRGMGFMETKTFILTNKEKLEAAGSSEEVVEISNPGTADFTVVRPSLLVDMLDTFALNKMKGLPQKFYEIGLVQDGGRTRRRVVFGMMDRSVGFSDFRGFLQTLMSEKSLRFSLEKSESAVFTAETSCRVLVGKKHAGVLGKVRPEALGRYGIGFDVYICELEL